MAVAAFEIFDFIFNKNTIILIYLEMTFVAGHILMLPLQFKAGFIMLKFFGQPIFKTMTLHAVFVSFIIKLTQVNIGVALGTIGRKPAKTLNGFVIHFAEMAGATLLSGMCAVENKSGFLVVEGDLAPVRNGVASGAFLAPEILIADIIFMNIFVAIDAACTHIFEIPSLAGLMAGEAGRCTVRPFQWEIRFSVAIDPKRRRRESLHRVATGAIGILPVFDKLPAMKVFVAVETLLVG